MDFSLTTLFVVPVSNALPVSGSTENLVAGKFGIFKDAARTIATAGNIAAANYIQLAQGRTSSAYVGSKISDKIKASKLKSFYKVAAQPTPRVQITEVSNIVVDKGEDFTLTVRLHSSYIDTVAYNGLTRSVTVPAECLTCGEDPCTDADAEDIVDKILAYLDKVDSVQNDPASINLTDFLTFEKIGSGSSAKIRIIGKALTRYGNECDVSAFPYEYDRMWFRVWAYKGAETSVDFLVQDACDSVATVTVTQRSAFVRGSSDEAKQLEKDYYSYQSYHKHLFDKVGYNQLFESFVTDGTFYDMYVITFDEMAQDNSWTPNIQTDERVILLIPSGEAATIETILETYLGNSTDESGTAITTTTTTSTSSTTTTSTTVLVP